MSQSETWDALLLAAEPRSGYGCMWHGRSEVAERMMPEPEVEWRRMSFSLSALDFLDQQDGDPRRCRLEIERTDWLQLGDELQWRDDATRPSYGGFTISSEFVITDGVTCRCGLSTMYIETGSGRPTAVFVVANGDAWTTADTGITVIPGECYLWQINVHDGVARCWLARRDDGLPELPILSVSSTTVSATFGDRFFGNHFTTR